MSLEAILTYTTPTEIISAAAQVEILALIDVFATAIGGTAQDNSYPNGRDISPQLKDRLLLEIAALKAAIDAAPTA